MRYVVLEVVWLGRSFFSRAQPRGILLDGALLYATLLGCLWLDVVPLFSAGLLGRGRTLLLQRLDDGSQLATGAGGFGESA